MARLLLFANISSILGVALDSANAVYASGSANGVIIKIAGGNATTFATGFTTPFALAFNSAGDLFVGNYGGTTISRVTPSGGASTYASGINSLILMAFSNSGDLFVGVNDGTNRVLKVTTTGTVSNFATVSSVPTGLAFNNVAVPESGSLALALTGITAGVVAVARRKKAVSYPEAAQEKGTLACK